MNTKPAMNIKPARNWILTNWIERNYEKKGNLFVSSVSTAFMNRHRVFAVGELDEDKTQVKPGDIVVVSRMARELSVVGQTKNSEGDTRSADLVEKGEQVWIERRPEENLIPPTDYRYPYMG